MPQGPLAFFDIAARGSKTALYVQTSLVLKAAPGTIARVNVLVAGAQGTVNDCTATAAAVTANEIAVIPATVGPVALDFPCLSGITVVPGSGQIISVAYV
jgi:hypothetical protein